MKKIILFLFLTCFLGSAGIHLFDPKFGRGFLHSENSVALKEGEELFKQKGCGSCHGQHGSQPIAENYPILSGQKRDYIFEQILHIRDGIRANGGSSYMKESVQGVSDSEAFAIASYLSQK